MKRCLAPLFILLTAIGAHAQPSPYSNALFNPVSMTATGQTSAPLKMAQFSAAGGGFNLGTVTVKATALTTVTFGILGSADNGVTYFPLNIWSVLTPGTAATTATATAAGLYQFSLAGITNIEFVTSGTFTATGLSLILTATPAPSVSKNSGGGGGATTFDQIGSGTNLGHGLVVGNGSVLSTATGGFINANEINGAVLPISAGSLATNSSGQVVAGTGGAVSYTGLVATRTEGNSTLNTSNTWIMARNFHLARSTVPANTMQLHFGNYYVTTSNTETNAGSATYKAAIEYPAGTIVPCTFGGNATITVAGLADALTDACGPAIPNGAMFWVRVLYTNTTGIIFSSYVTNHWSATLDGNAIGTGTPNDLVNSGTVPAGSSAFQELPNAIIGTTSYPSLCVIGDSRPAGQNDSVNDATGDVGEMVRAIGPVFAYTKLSASGTDASNFVANSTGRARLLPYCSHVIDEYGINDINQALESPATVAAARVSIATLVAKPVIGTTIPPRPPRRTVGRRPRIRRPCRPRTPWLSTIS
jgi:hypothetical protein